MTAAAATLPNTFTSLHSNGEQADKVLLVPLEMDHEH